MNPLLKKLEKEMSELEASIMLNAKLSAPQAGVILKYHNMRLMYQLLLAYKDKKLERVTFNIVEA